MGGHLKPLALAMAKLNQSIAANIVVTVGLTGIVLAIVVTLRPSIRQASKTLRLVSYFVLINVSSAVALSNVMLGNRVTVWQPRTGD